MSKWYNEQLKNPLWQRKRLEVMQRDNFTCTLCGDNRTTLNIHHEQYSGNPWEISIDKLKTLCYHCHTATHLIQSHKITHIHKCKATHCFEMTVFTENNIIFLYMFVNQDTDRCEVITVYSNIH